MKVFAVTKLRRVMLLAVVVVIIGAHTGRAQQQYWTGDGGKGMGITIYAPQAVGLGEKQSHLPALVLGKSIIRKRSIRLKCVTHGRNSVIRIKLAMSGFERYVVVWANGEGTRR